MKRKFKLVVNPVAGNKAIVKIGKDFDKKVASILGDISAEFTKDANDATRITRNALREDYDTIIAIGGDGTINEVVNGFFDNGKLINAEAKLGIISVGTGSDWIKTLEFPKDLEKAMVRIQADNIRKCDLGLLKCRNLGGNPIARYFINIADAGFGGTMIHSFNNSTKALGHFFAYLTGLLRTLSVYKDTAIKIQIDDTVMQEQIVKSVVIANGQFFGGGMWVAPDAKIDDGFFEIVIIGNLTRPEVLASIHRLYNGTIARHPKVKAYKGKKVLLNSEVQVLIEADGELAGKLPASFEILPTQLNLLC